MAECKCWTDNRNGIKHECDACKKARADERAHKQAYDALANATKRVR